MCGQSEIRRHHDQRDEDVQAQAQRGRRHPAAECLTPEQSRCYALEHPAWRHTAQAVEDHGIEPIEQRDDEPSREDRAKCGEVGHALSVLVHRSPANCHFGSVR